VLRMKKAYMLNVDEDKNLEDGNRTRTASPPAVW